MQTVAQMLVVAAAFAGGGLLVGGAGLALGDRPVPVTAEVTGFYGNAGEWELTGILARQGDTRELAGPVKIAHVGWCSQDGPQEKAGTVRVRPHRLFARVDASLAIDGLECSYTGSLTDAYEGKLACPGRRPVQLLLWLR